MAYNFYLQSKQPIDWSLLHQICMTKEHLEYIPIPSGYHQSHDAFGISIPDKKMSIVAWNELLELYYQLSDRFLFKWYDLYSGLEVNDRGLEVTRTKILGELNEV